MEEKRRQFDASLAKVGDVVENRNGFKVRIICLDRQQAYSQVVGLLKDVLTGEELIKSYTKDGRYLTSRESGDDLFFPLKEHTGYVNIFDNVTGAKTEDFELEQHVEPIIYNDKNKAIENGTLFKGYITTIQITYKR